MGPIYHLQIQNHPSQWSSYLSAFSGGQFLETESVRHILQASWAVTWCSKKCFSNWPIIENPRDIFFIYRSRNRFLEKFLQSSQIIFTNSELAVYCQFYPGVYQIYPESNMVGWFRRWRLTLIFFEINSLGLYLFSNIWIIWMIA